MTDNPLPIGVPVSTTAPDSSARNNKIRALHVLVLGGLSALGPLSTDLYLPALPTISQELAASMTETQFTLSAGILGLALGQVIAGPSSDALGRRRPLLIGLAAFTVASLLCTLAPTIPVLILLRFVQGLAGSAGISIALAVVSDLYNGTARARLFSLLAQVTGIAPIVAPIIGSQLLSFTSWHGAFIALALFGGLLWVAIWQRLPETLPSERRQTGGIGSLLQAFRQLLQDRYFVGYALSCGFAFAACIVYISASPFVLQNLYGLSPQWFGFVFGLNAFGIVLMAQVNGRLVGKVTPRTLFTWGISLFTGGCLLLLGVVLAGLGLTGILPTLFLIVASLGLIGPNATTLALANTTTAGSAAALLGVLQLTIGALAAPLVGLADQSTALPMAIAMAGFGGAALLTFLSLCRQPQVDI